MEEGRGYVKSLGIHLCFWSRGRSQEASRLGVCVQGVPLNWVGPKQALGSLASELQQNLRHLPSSERGEVRGGAGSKRGRQRKMMGTGAFKCGRRRSSPGQGLDDHGLQEAEAHHEVQWDGWLQEVPIQPQVAQVWHVL